MNKEPRTAKALLCLVALALPLVGGAGCASRDHSDPVAAAVEKQRQGQPPPTLPNAPAAPKAGASDYAQPGPMPTRSNAGK